MVNNTERSSGGKAFKQPAEQTVDVIKKNRNQLDDVAWLMTRQKDCIDAYHKLCRSWFLNN
jgi:hypothetical protein